MSATNRTKASDGEISERAENDHYETPSWCTWVLTDYLKEQGIDLEGKSILEPAAGTGLMMKDLRDRTGANLYGVELDPFRADLAKARDVGPVVCGDYLKSTDLFDGQNFSAVITNPPYSGPPLPGTKKKQDYALFFARQSIVRAPLVCLLLRIGWAGSASRHEFHKANPADLALFSQRPKFKNNAADSAEYAWWVWQRGATIGTWTVRFSKDAPKPGRTKKLVAVP